MIYSTVMSAVRDILTAALPDADVQRGRARAVAEEQQKAVRIGMNVVTSETYTTGDGRLDFRMEIRIAFLARSTNDDADIVAAQLHDAAHNALRADNTLGIPGLTLDMAFTATDDVEDLDDSLAGIAAVYVAQYCTESSDAN